MRIAAGRLLPLLLAISLLAGCFSVPDEDEQEPRVPPPPLAFAPRTLWLSPDEALVERPPEQDDSIGVGDFILKWATGTDTHPQFDKSFEPNVGLEWVSSQNASVTLYITTDQPVLPAEGALPDVAVWLGSSYHAPLVASAKLDGPLLPDEVHEVSFDVSGPEMQPHIAALGGISLIVTVTMTQMEEHNVRILTGGEHASRVELETRPFHADDLDGDQAPEITNETIDGDILLFDRVLGPLEGPEATYADHEIQIGEDHQFLLALVETTGGGHTVDMDMQLLDPQGETITWGVTPYAFELLWLVGEALTPYRGETLTLRVANHLGINMEYEGIIQTG